MSTATTLRSQSGTADTNPFRYCGEYFDSETGTYYLRARYYDPAIGRFTQADTHWTVANMIYGDTPQKINEREDALGLKTYTYAPQISAIMQSGNLYVYGANNPVMYVDANGHIAFIVATALVGVVIGGVTGAIQSYSKYGEVHWKNVAIGVGIGGIAGLSIGSAAAYLATGSVIASTGSVFAVGSSSTVIASQISEMISNVMPNRINHIMQAKHAWNLVGANDWTAVSRVINTVLTSGTSIVNDVGNIVYSYVYKAHTIEVTTRVVDGVLRIVDAWVKTK